MIAAYMLLNEQIVKAIQEEEEEEEVDMSM